MRNVVGAFTRFIAHITRNPLGMAGAVLTTVSAMLFVTLFVLDVVGFHGGPYIGILAFLIIPGVFVFGLLLIPLGLWRERVRHRRAIAAGKDDEETLPVWDLNVDRVRRNVLVFLLLSVVNVVILAAATYKGVEVMESTQFCGAACHSVMEPEFTTYKRSPHARVKCVECHIGEGANWFVKSKLSGSWQLVSVAFALYPRPIDGAGPQPAAGARDLRAVPLAEQVRGRPLPGEHALLRGRGQHRDQDRAGREGGRPAGGPEPGHPLARRPRPRGALPGRREAADGVRGRDDGEGRHHAPLQGAGRRLARKRRPRASGARWTASIATTGRPTSTGSPRASSTRRSSTGASTRRSPTCAARA